ncbi:hypothetical protein D3C79_582400 [compost metagenome]
MRIATANIDLLNQRFDVVDVHPRHDQLAFTVLNRCQRRALKRAEVADGKLRKGHGPGFYRTAAHACPRATGYPPGDREGQVQVVRQVVGFIWIIGEQLLA